MLKMDELCEGFTNIFPPDLQIELFCYMVHPDFDVGMCDSFDEGEDVVIIRFSVQHMPIERLKCFVSNFLQDGMRKSTWKASAMWNCLTCNEEDLL